MFQQVARLNDRVSADKAEDLTKFHKDVLGGIKGHFLKVLAHQNLDGVLVPVLRDVLTHQVRL